MSGITQVRRPVSKLNPGRSLILPGVTVVILLIIFPAIDLLLSARHEWGIPNVIQRIDLLEIRHAVFLTTIYTICSVFMQCMLGLFSAAVLHRMFSPFLSKFCWILIFAPYTLPSAVTALAFRLLVDSNGFISKWLVELGYAPSLQYMYASEGLFTTLVVASGWQLYPFVTVALLAQMRRIDSALYRTAQIDGATSWQQFLHVTWPEVRNTFFAILLVRILFMYTKFDLPWILGGYRNAEEVNTLPVLIGRRLLDGSATDYPLAMLAVIPAIIIIILILLMVLFSLAWEKQDTTGFKKRNLPIVSSVYIRQKCLSKKSIPLRIFVCLVFGLLMLFSLVPIMTLFVASFTRSSHLLNGLDLNHLTWQQLTLQNYKELFFGNCSDTSNDCSDISVHMNWVRVIYRTLMLSGSSAIFVACISMLTGYCLTRFRYRKHALWEKSVLLGYVFPPIVLAFPYHHILTNLLLLNTLFGLWLSHVAFCFPLGVWLMVSFFNAIPQQIDMIAEVDGATRFQTLRRILFQYALPGFAAVFSFSFILSWNEIVLAQYLLDEVNSRPLVPYIYELIFLDSVDETKYGTFAAASTLIALFALIMLGMINSWVDNRIRLETST